MRKAIILMLALGAGPAGAFPASGMVPYPMQRLAELREVTSLPGLAERLGEPIERVERIAENSWRVTAGVCHVDVTFVRVRSPLEGRVGPRYRPQMGERICSR